MKSNKCVFWLSSYETKNQLPEEKWKLTNRWRLKNMLLKIQWVEKEVRRNLKYLYRKTNKNGNMAHQNWLDIVKSAIRRKFKNIKIYFNKKERVQVDNPTL